MLSFAASAQTFTCQTIPDSVFVVMQGKSYKKNCTVPRSELRYLRLSHWITDNKEEVGELVCNKAIAQDLLKIFRELYDAHYLIARMRLIDEYDAQDEASMRDNNTSCFNFRFISGTNTVSKHGRGMAIDINPLYNPYVYTRAGVKHVEPATSKRWAYRRDTRKDIPMKIDHNDLLYRLFKKYGFKWGGDWKTLKDYQHFEK